MDRDRRNIYRRRPAVDAADLGPCDALELALAAQDSSRIRRNPEHSRETLAAAVLVSIGCSVRPQ